MQRVNVSYLIVSATDPAIVLVVVVVVVVVIVVVEEGCVKLVCPVRQ